jgi:hypothetical protein
LEEPACRRGASGSTLEEFRRSYHLGVVRVADLQPGADDPRPSYRYATATRPLLAFRHPDEVTRRLHIELLAFVVADHRRFLPARCAGALATGNDAGESRQTLRQRLAPWMRLGFSRRCARQHLPKRAPASTSSRVVLGSSSVSRASCRLLSVSLFGPSCWILGWGTSSSRD